MGIVHKYKLHRDGEETSHVRLEEACEYHKELEYRQQGIPIALDELERLEKTGREFGVKPGMEARHQELLLPQ